MNERLSEVWRIGSWQVSPDLGEISRGDQRKKLDPRAMRMLVFLAERPGQVVGVRELLDGVWGSAVVTPHSVYEAVAALRQALEDPADAPQYITNLPRRGYRLIAPTERFGLNEPPDTSSAVPTTAPSAEIVTPTPSGRRRKLVVGGLLAIAAVGATVWVGRGALAPSERVPPQKSIAVLPFVDLSESHDQEYFADGLAEELLDVLTTVPGLRVIGRTSSFQFKNKNEDIRTIGAALGASYLVEGSVRRSGKHVRVAAQLIRTADGVHEWAEAYDRNFDDAIQLESDLATSLGRALELSVATSVVSNPIDTGNPEANEHYLRGLQALDAYTRVSIEEAIDQFKASVSLDPQFAAAHLMLGKAHYAEAWLSFARPEVGFQQAREDAEKALEFKPHSALAHALLARVATLNTWDWQEAQRQSDVALALAPQDPFALFASGDVAFVLGKWDQAERLYRAALVSDPLNPETYVQLSGVLDAKGQIREAEAASRRALAISPSYSGVHFELALLLGMQGREEATAECQREAPEGNQFPCLAEVNDMLGHKSEADVALKAAMQDHGDGQALWIAAAFANRRQDALAFEWLDRAYRQKDPFLAFIKAEGEFDHLKNDARYKAFLRRMHLPE